MEPSRQNSDTDLIVMIIAGALLLGGAGAAVTMMWHKVIAWCLSHGAGPALRLADGGAAQYRGRRPGPVAAGSGRGCGRHRPRADRPRDRPHTAVRATAMRGVSRRVLAQHLAMMIAAEDRAECRGSGKWWSEREAAHAAASSRLEAAAAAAPAVALCARCPVIGRCGELAQVDSYTGLAAGAAYIDGRELRPHQCRRNPAFAARPRHSPGSATPTASSPEFPVNTPPCCGHGCAKPSQPLSPNWTCLSWRGSRPASTGALRRWRRHCMPRSQLQRRNSI